MSERLRGVERVGQPDPPTPSTIDQAPPLIEKCDACGRRTGSAYHQMVCLGGDT